MAASGVDAVRRVPAAATVLAEHLADRARPVGSPASGRPASARLHPAQYGSAGVEDGHDLVVGVLVVELHRPVRAVRTAARPGQSRGPGTGRVHASPSTSAPLMVRVDVTGRGE